MSRTNSDEGENAITAVLYGSPYDAASGDLAVRASDNVFFLVPKLLVTLAPSLRDRLATSEGGENDCPYSTLIGDRAVLSLSYPSPIVAYLLSTLLPVPLVLPKTFNDAALVLSAARELGITRCADIMKHVLRLDDLILSDPIGAYFTASQHDLPEEMLRAAKYSLGHDLRLEDHNVPGDFFYRLYTYRQAWVPQSSIILTTFNLRYSRTPFWTEEHPQTIDGCVFLQPSWPTLLSSWISEALKTPLRINRTMLGLNLAHCELISSRRCPHCSKIDLGKLEAFCTELEESASHGFRWIPLSWKPDPYAFMSCIKSEPGSLDKVHPNHSRADADVILRSCDGVLFRTHKIILSISSAFFEDMFSLPKVSSASAPISPDMVQMTESATTLESLLSVILPITTVIPDNYPEYLLVLAAAQKFDMDYALVTLRAGASTGVKPSDPCLVYGIASHLRLREEALSAAKELLACPMTIEHYKNNICYLSADALQLLLSYRDRCQETIQTLATNDDILHNALWDALGSPGAIQGCKTTITRNTHPVPGWIASLRSAKPGDRHALLDRPLSAWAQSDLEDAIASHTATSPPCTYCRLLSRPLLYRTVSTTLREMTIRSITFPTWD
ncbi:unnamed protein product [Peniophora sp. CBMAI 1063]|nr:unnamed protein product [Peniophora sp. CBMAI 1063]